VEDCLCGVSQGSGLQACEADIDKRIAGGEEAGVNEFPWAALLEIKAGGTPLRCGGTLINDRLVVQVYQITSEPLSINQVCLNSSPLCVQPLCLGHHCYSW
jgi:hypothetical protein